MMRIPFSVGLLELHDQQKSRWVLIKNEASASGQEHWSFPGFTQGPGAELKFAADLHLSENGCPVRLPQPADLSAFAGIPITRARVTNSSQVQLDGPETTKCRPILLAGIADIEQLIASGALCTASVELWLDYWSAVAHSDYR